MPPYEIALILRLAARKQMIDTIKRVCHQIEEHGGHIGQLQKLGEQPLPYKMRKHGERFSEGFYMFVESNLPAQNCTSLLAALNRDKDIIRPNIVRYEEENKRPCEQGECFWGELTNTEHSMVKKWGTFTKLSA